MAVTGALSGTTITSLNSAIAGKQATIPATFTMALGFQALWDTATTTIKGLICTAPLLVTSTTSYLTLALSTTVAYTMGSLTCTGFARVGSIQSEGSATIISTLTVGGSINCASIVSSAVCWASGKVSTAGVLQTTGTNGAAFWSVAKISTGVYRATFISPHPSGLGYTVLVTPVNGYANIRGANTTSAYFEVATFTTAGVAADGYWHFMVMNW